MSIGPLPDPRDKKRPPNNYFDDERRSNLRFLFWLIIAIVILGYLGMGGGDKHWAGY